MRSGFPSTPPSGPSPYRQLGSGGQQPVRVQMILGLVVGLVLVAVPLYLWRRPEQASGEDSSAAEDAGASIDGATPYVPLVDASASGPGVKLSPFTTVRCADPGPGKTPPERCDHITFFEDGLARAIRDNSVCAPQTTTGASISFVMDIDFRREKLRLYRGKSSSLPEAQSNELFACVRRALPTPDWASISHQHARYVVALTATFPPSETF